MVQLMRSGINRRRSGLETAGSGTSGMPVKVEIEDPLEEENGPLNKRSRSCSASASASFNQWSPASTEFPIPPSQYNPLDEPSPLGLRLRKSPSLLDLIQMKLSQGSSSSSGATSSENLNTENKKDVKGSGAASGSTEKLKASNFPASLLRIGCWEYVSNYEGDLVAKCYFAKHKLVWEVLDCGLKSKIEIQWSDIMALKASCPDDGPGSLTVVLARQPLFFKETNPQPRKHTLWQATADFTDGQASRHRQHFLQCPQGLLNKHYEKLIQCDMRLNFLSQQPDMVLESLYFETQASLFEDLDDSKGHEYNQQEKKDKVVEHLSEEAAPSLSSARDTDTTKWNENDHFSEPKNQEQTKTSGLRSSISMSDLVNHIGHCISEKMTEMPSDCQDMLENIAQVLLSDTTQFTTSSSDEKSLMKKVNSLCCLLQDPTDANGPEPGPTTYEGDRGGNTILEGQNEVAMSRKDSLGDLLLHLPQITSLPKFLFGICEDGDETQSS